LAHETQIVDGSGLQPPTGACGLDYRMVIGCRLLRCFGRSCFHSLSTSSVDIAIRSWYDSEWCSPRGLESYGISVPHFLAECLDKWQLRADLYVLYVSLIYWWYEWSWVVISVGISQNDWLPSDPTLKYVECGVKLYYSLSW